MDPISFAPAKPGIKVGKHGRIWDEVFLHRNRRRTLSFYIVQLAHHSKKEQKVPKWVEVETSHEPNQIRHLHTPGCVPERLG